MPTDVSTEIIQKQKNMYEEALISAGLEQGWGGISLAVRAVIVELGAWDVPVDHIRKAINERLQQRLSRREIREVIAQSNNLILQLKGEALRALIEEHMVSARSLVTNLADRYKRNNEALDKMSPDECEYRDLTRLVQVDERELMKIAGKNTISDVKGGTKYDQLMQSMKTEKVSITIEGKPDGLDASS